MIAACPGRSFRTIFLIEFGLGSEFSSVFWRGSCYRLGQERSVGIEIVDFKRVFEMVSGVLKF